MLRTARKADGHPCGGYWACTECRSILIDTLSDGRQPLLGNARITIGRHRMSRKQLHGYAWQPCRPSPRVTVGVHALSLGV
jgi:hypothetical protein